MVVITTGPPDRRAAVKSCASCHIERDASAFDLDIRGLSRRTCRPCLELVADLLLGGLTVPQVSEETGVGKYTIRRLIADTPGLSGTKRRLRDTDAAVARYREGASVEAIAAEFDVSERTVFRHLRRAGVRQHDDDIPQVERETLLNQAHLFLQDGTTYAEAAESVGLPVEVVRQQFPGFGRNVEAYRATMSSLRTTPGWSAIYEDMRRIRIDA